MLSCGWAGGGGPVKPLLTGPSNIGTPPHVADKVNEVAELVDRLAQHAKGVRIDACGNSRRVWGKFGKVDTERPRTYGGRGAGNIQGGDVPT